MTKIWKSIALTAAIFPALGNAALCADAAHGRDLAKRWCAACHIVEPTQTRSTEAPPFTAIAQRPDFDAAALAYFLMSPHPVMPNMGLSRTEAADIAAYIKTLTK